MRQGASRPLYPHGRGIPPAPVLRRGRLFEQTSFRMWLGETEREPTGAMKTMKKGWQGKRAFPPAFFLFSPDAKHPVGGVSHRQPVGGRQWRIQLAKRPSLSAKGFLRVAVAHPIRKNTFVLCKSMCACYFVSPGHCSCVENYYFRLRVKGRCPLWGAGVKPRMVPLAPPGNRMKNTDCYFRKKGQGAMPLVTCIGQGLFTVCLQLSVIISRYYGKKRIKR